MKIRQSAFTLLEIMLVVAIIGVLLAAAIYKMSPALGVAKETRTRADIQGIRTMLLSYNGSTGSYPTTEQGLSALVPRLMEELPKDAYGSPYIYRYPGRRNPASYDLFSAGPDRIPDTADDDWGK
jgi:general secretion pathway protein G